MLSVLKHTKNPVKFWFLKNFLSPTFKVCVCTRVWTSSWSEFWNSLLIQ